MKQERLSQHENIVLLFSGGLDSLALLYLFREYWSRLYVVWINTGDAFQETIDQMDRIRDLVPHFCEVESDQPAQIAANGIPADVMSAWDTTDGNFLMERNHRFQSPIACCHFNRWLPTMNTIKDIGATLVITGQRHQDGRHSQVMDGDRLDGVEFYYPLHDWSRDDVKHYLKNSGINIPASYEFMETSLDCQLCTAYADEGAGRVAYMKAHAPDMLPEFKRRVHAIISSAEFELNNVRAAYGTA